MVKPMNDIPENKQKRLMSLNQDVLAVSTATPSSHGDRARAAGQAARAVRAQVEEKSSQPGRSRSIAVAIGALAVVMLVVLGVVSMMLLTMQQRVDQLQATIDAMPATPASDIEGVVSGVAVLEQQLAGLTMRVGTLEQQPPTVIESRAGDGGNQAGMAQVTARLRKLDIETTRLSADMGALRTELAAVQGRASRTETLANAQRDQLAGLNPRVDALEGSSATVAELQDRLERASNDIRSLYRMLEMGR